MCRVKTTTCMSFVYPSITVQTTFLGHTGTVAALVILCITICAVYLCTKCRKKQLTERNTNPSPCMEAIQETEKPASPMLKERDNLVRRQPRGTATTRDEVTFSTTANDDMRSITIPMPAEHEERYILLYMCRILFRAGGALGYPHH